MHERRREVGALTREEDGMGFAERGGRRRQCGVE